MSEPMRVKVNGRYQISLPSRARQTLNIQAGDRLLVDIQNGMILLIPQPQDFVTEVAGLYATVWQEVETVAYLNDERGAGQPRP